MATKKRTIKKFEIQKRSDISADLLPVVQNLTAQGYTLADVGILLGFAGKDPEGWLKRLEAKFPTLAEAIQAGKSMGDIELVKTAFEQALGHWVDGGEEIRYKAIQDPQNPTKVKWIQSAKKKLPAKFIPGNGKLLFQLLCSRLPEYFSDTRRVEIDKKVLELKGNVKDEILGFAGALAAAVENKEIECKFVEKENE